MLHVIHEIPGVRDLLPLATAQADRYPLLLESAARGNARARYDILFAFPQEALRLVAPGDVRDEQGIHVGTHFLSALDARWRAQRVERDALSLPFRGGWVLYLGYELAQEIEPSLDLPPEGIAGMPIALALRCPAAVIVDHERNCTMLVAEAEHAHRLDAMQADLDSALPAVDATLPVDSLSEEAPERFLDGVARVHEHLLAGDVFQVNLSRLWQARSRTAPSALHAALRRANPAPFAGLLQQAGWAVASSSPERLIEIRGNQVQTRPIAGTRPRFDGDDDAVRVHELVGNPKERAEHVMLIDLERNDLGRLCMPGSVFADEIMQVESYAHVHHIVSNVRGRLRADVTPGEAIAAVFPGGTITGCPKVRCMRIIADLEGAGRGAYTGSFGYLNRDGDLDLNILIRTLTLAGGVLRFRAGAGIVIDSVAERELDETRAKARGLLRALGQSS